MPKQRSKSPKPFQLQLEKSLDLTEVDQPLFRRLVEEKTGYPAEMLELSMDMEAWT